MVNYLIDHGADIHRKDVFDHTPLTIAAFSDFTKDVSLIFNKAQQPKIR